LNPSSTALRAAETPDADRASIESTTREKAKPMQKAMNDQANRRLVLAWALLDRAEHLARQAARDEPGPSLWLLAANSILRARDTLEAIHPAAPHTNRVDVLPAGTCQDLVRAAVCELASIPRGHEPLGLSLALVHLADAEHETGGRFCP
jgi:hypothetical protein